MAVLPCVLALYQHDFYGVLFLAAYIQQQEVCSARVNGADQHHGPRRLDHHALPCWAQHIVCRFLLQVRVVRSAELVAQRRRVDSHLKAQEKAVQQQAAQIDAAVLALRADAAAWRSKLLDYERLLGNALSSKGIDICWREAQALRVKLDKQLEQRMQELRRLVDETCSSVAATSTAFEAEHLKSFAGQ